MELRIAPAQIRGARGMLNWSMLDLAGAAGVSVSTIKRIEGGEPQPLSDDIRMAVSRALEAAGVHFLDDDGGGAGLRLAPRGRAPAGRCGP